MIVAHVIEIPSLTCGTRQDLCKGHDWQLKRFFLLRSSLIISMGKYKLDHWTLGRLDYFIGLFFGLFLDHFIGGGEVDH